MCLTILYVPIPQKNSLCATNRCSVIFNLHPPQGTGNLYIVSHRLALALVGSEFVFFFALEGAVLL
jgi:hypothetical protein